MTWIWVKRGVAAIALLLALLLATASVWKFLRDREVAKNYPPPGRLVDLNHRRLHLHCQGSGPPTVILEAGAGDWSLTWSMVQPAIASFAQVCVYDRAGLGWSDQSPSPPDSKHVAGDLRELLQRAGVHGPYVLVGHSLGGIHVRLYAATYPDEVAGVVLVDSAHEEQNRRFQEARVPGPSPAWNYYLLLAAPFGATRSPAAGLRPPDFRPAEIQRIDRAVSSSTRHVQAKVREVLAADACLEQMRASARTLGNKRLVVLTQGRALRSGSTLDRIWIELQKDLLKWSRNSEWMVAENSGHPIQRQEPEKVVEAVRRAIQY